jgi:hypothetical protein
MVVLMMLAVSSRVPITRTSWASGEACVEDWRLDEGVMPDYRS